MSLRTRNGRLPSGPKPRKNYCTNPAFRATSGTVEVRRNLFTNPSAASGNTNFGVYASPGTAAASHQTGAGMFGNGFSRLQWTSNSPDPIGGIYVFGIPVVAGSVYTASIYVRSNIAQVVRPAIEWKDGPSGGATISSNTGAPVTLIPNVWTRLSIINATAATGALSMTMTVYGQAAGGIAWQTGDYIDADGVLAENAATLMPFFDGSTTAAEGLTYSWVGTANASASIITAPRPVGTDWHPTGGASWQSPLNAPYGRYTLAVAANKHGSNDSFSAVPLPYGELKVGKTYVLSGTVTLTAPQGSGAGTFARNFRVTWNGVPLTVTQVQTAPNTAGTHRVISKFTVPSPYASSTFVRVYNGGPVGDPTVYWSDIVIEEDGPVTGTFFDGSSFESTTAKHRWTGTADASTSEAIKKHPLSILDIDGVTWRTMENIVQRKNLVYNPRGAGTTGLVNVRTNMFKNPSFETNTTDHYASSGVTLSRVSTWSDSGGYSLEVASNGVNSDGYSNISQDSDPTSTVGGIRYGMVAGKTYTVSGTIQIPAPLTGAVNGRGRKIVVFTRSPSVNGNNYVETFSNVGVDGATTRVSATFTIPSDGTEAFIRLYNGSPTAGEVVRWDSLVLEEGQSAGPYFDGSTTNVALNPGAEVNTTNIVNMGTSGSTITRDTAIKRSGTASAKIVANGPNGAGAKWTITTNTLRPGQIATWIGWVYSDVAITLSPYAEGSKVDGSYSGGHTNPNPASMTTVAGKWTRLSYTYTVNSAIDPTRTYGAGFLFATPSAGLTVWVDDVTISLDPYGDDFTYAWSGTAHASKSYQQAPNANGWSANSSNTTGLNSIVYKRANGTVRMRTPVGQYSWNLVAVPLDNAEVRPGHSVTFLFKCALGGGWSSGLNSKTITLLRGNGSDGVGVSTSPFNLTSTMTEIRAKLVATADPAADAHVYFGIASGTISSECWIDFEYMYVFMEDYNGAFFDGASTATPDYTFSWSGAANNSVSIATPS